MIITNFRQKVLTTEHFEFNGLYINMMDSIRNADGSISFFTPDGKWINHNGLHLSKAGAKEFAKIINVNNLITNIKF